MLLLSVLSVGSGGEGMEGGLRGGDLRENQSFVRLICANCRRSLNGAGPMGSLDGAKLPIPYTAYNPNPAFFSLSPIVSYMSN